MKERAVTIQLKGGLEARPVAKLVQLASFFESTVYMQSGDKKVNAKSIMGMMSLGLDVGEVITIQTEGKDEDAAIERIENYLNGTYN